MPSSQQIYRARGAADALFGHRDQELLIEGPAGTGKTRAVLEKCFAVACKYDGARVLICRKTRASMTESAMVTLERDVIPPGSAWVGEASRRTRQAYKLPNGSTIVIGGLDRPDRIMSTEWDVVAVFEATETTEDDVEKLTSRLGRHNAAPYAQLICDCNPGAPTHWLNRRAKAGRMVRLLSRHEDNPLLHDGKGWTPAGASYIARLDRLTGPRLQRLRYGRWATAEGVVYDSFDAAKHLVMRFPIPRGARRIIAIDFGYNHPFVAQWWAEIDNVLYRYREIYMTRTLVEDHARRIKAICDRDGEWPEAIVCDHDAEGRATLERYLETGTVPADKESVLDGIERVSTRLRGGGKDNSPRLYMMRDSLVERDEERADAKQPTCTEDEIDGYVWKRSRDGTQTKDEPVKQGDDGCDAMRYAVGYFDTGPVQAPSVPTAEQAGREFERPSMRG